MRRTDLFRRTIIVAVLIENPHARFLHHQALEAAAAKPCVLLVATVRKLLARHTECDRRKLSTEDLVELCLSRLAKPRDPYLWMEGQRSRDCGRVEIQDPFFRWRACAPSSRLVVDDYPHLLSKTAW
jgi:hypothetical protein